MYACVCVCVCVCLSLSLSLCLSVCALSCSLLRNAEAAAFLKHLTVFGPSLCLQLENWNPENWTQKLQKHPVCVFTWRTENPTNWTQEFCRNKKTNHASFSSFYSELSLSHDDAIVLVLIKTWQWDPIWHVFPGCWKLGCNHRALIIIKTGPTTLKTAFLEHLV